MAEELENGGSVDVDAELEGGNYEVIKQRLTQQGQELLRLTESLNTQRKDLFGGSELKVIANERVRTANNCVPRDIVTVNGLMLFGYNVFMGLKQETAVADVMALHRFEAADGGYDCSAVPLDAADGFLLSKEFTKAFSTLYRYYRDARLLQLVKNDTNLLAAFQVGTEHTDIKVFHWRIEGDGRVVFVDDRGASIYVAPPTHDFEWTELERDSQVTGAYPHYSIDDTLFVENTGGDITVKIENNTSTGEGIYSDPVNEVNQTLDDGHFAYAKLGGLYLIEILPFREEAWRYLVFNPRTSAVTRIDAIGDGCRQLPEDHGIVFPGGYYLSGGTHKLFEGDNDDMSFERMIKSPNGEDILYVFHRRGDGLYALLSYNLIRKEVDTPIHCHGYSLFDDGRLVVFRSVSEEPTRVHPMQVWQTPFTSAEFAASTEVDDSFLAKVGNAELVRGISDSFAVTRLIAAEEPGRHTFEDVVATSARLIDSYYWLGNAEVGDLKTLIQKVARTAELIIGEFEKVLEFRNLAESSLAAVEEQVAELEQKLRSEAWNAVDPFLGALTTIRSQRGHIITAREVRYIDTDRLDQLEEELVQHFDRISRDCVTYLLRDEAFRPLREQLDATLVQLEKVGKVADTKPLKEQVDATVEGLDLLTEVVANLQIDDATQRTTILEGVSEVFGHANGVRATIDARYRELISHEGKAEFGAQFTLLGQSVSGALTMCDTPDRCDEELARIMVQLEELEARFSELDEFLGDLAAKREEVYDAFSGRKQVLVDERQRRAQNLIKAADRIIRGVGRRAGNFKSADEVNGYFAADAMVMKLRQLAEQLSDLGDSVKSEEIGSKLKTAKQDAIRALRDKLELFEDGDDILRFGKHRFRVNTQVLELSMVARDEHMSLHLNGTDFYETILDGDFEATRPYWSQDLVSETNEVYRGEYLAASVLDAADRGSHGLDATALHAAMHDPDALLAFVRNYAQERYDEGYERGLHDVDAGLILGHLLAMRESAALLRYAATPRSLAVLYWAWHGDDKTRDAYHVRAQNMGRLQEVFGDDGGVVALAEELASDIQAFFSQINLPAVGTLPGDSFAVAGRYLCEELRAEHPRFVVSADAIALREAMTNDLQRVGARDVLDGIEGLGGGLEQRFSAAYAWLQGYAVANRPELSHALIEAAVLYADAGVEREQLSAQTSVHVKGLLGRHPRIVDRGLGLRIDEFIARLGHFASDRVPGYKAYRNVRHELLVRERDVLRLEEFKPKVMTSFVRNKLINDVYLPLIGDNLSKQIGAAGDKKRTDLMGLLLLISPPGYGKTTLMEYVANRLGLVFVKVNGPALGHSVLSLDPEEAPNATARQEVEKINLGLEMGNNVMLYLDDIQHTNPELLQKFISLCDAQRRIEGVWKGKTQTYDMRGKRFCVVMAGNPYTESGESFQIPDMLSNRADVYNLGDILEGQGDTFALSYIENSLTSNTTLAPLAAREQTDVYKLVRMARGEQIATSELDHGYSSSELDEILAVLRHISTCQDVLLKVNQGYILSAAQDDKFRTEPPFKLQGSYRNMNKLAEKVVSAMTPEEVKSLIADHYLGEAQTLTTEAEQNLLKLGEIMGTLDESQSSRWETIKREYQRIKSTGGGDDDPVTRVTGTLTGLTQQLQGIRTVLSEGASTGIDERLAILTGQVSGIREVLAAPSAAHTTNSLSEVANELQNLRVLATQALANEQKRPDEDA
ncbi:MAG: AAA domain-containing protein [Myxococcales bacterium]|nr:AAA domain-containing protein [Myxococcales bacterium]